MKARHLILLLLNAQGGSIDTKTKVQKEIYFLSFNLKENYNFIPHYYGPYSFEVEAGLDELIGAGFVDVKSTVYGIDAEKGFEKKRYTYSINDSGKELVDDLKEQYSAQWLLIEDFNKNLGSIAGIDYMSLSVAAKIYFILSRESRSLSELSEQDIVDKANQFQWQGLDSKQIKRASDILKKLELVKI